MLIMFKNLIVELIMFTGLIVMLIIFMGLIDMLTIFTGVKATLIMFMRVSINLNFANNWSFHWRWMLRVTKSLVSRAVAPTQQPYLLSLTLPSKQHWQQDFMVNHNSYVMSKSFPFLVNYLTREFINLALVSMPISLHLKMTGSKIFVKKKIKLKNILRSV